MAMQPNDIKIKHWCFRPIETTQIDYTWIIDNFSGELSPISSPDFSSRTQNTHFKLRLQMNEINSSNHNGFYSILIIFLSTVKRPLTIKFIFSIVDNNGKKARSICDEVTYDGREPSPITFITKRDLIANKDKLLPNDRLTLLCGMSVIEKGEEISGQTRNANLRIPESDLPDNLEYIFVNKIQCDVELIVGPDDKKIQAHKAILVARSSHFRGMFENDTEESKNNQVTIMNFSPDMINEMLKFMYTDRVDNLDDTAKDLLIIANYYDLERLNIMCQESLTRNLTIENCAETLLLADLHNADALRRRTLDFINRHAKEVVQTAGFQAIDENHPRLAIEISTISRNNPMICPVLSEIDHLLLNSKLSDVTLVIGEEQLFAHKVVLAAQSPTFAEYFETSKTPNRLEILDIESVIMKEVLAFFYTGVLREEDDIIIVLKVLAVADIYKIRKLKELCVSNLLKKISIDTVVPILIEAGDYSVPELSKKALDFIQTNKAKILSLDNFKLLCSKKPELLFKILALDIQK